MWGQRVVIPPPGRKQVLDTLHDTHPGIMRMKSLGRNNNNNNNNSQHSDGLTLMQRLRRE